MADEDVQTDAVTEDKPASPFLADGDSKVGETAAEHEEHPDPAQPATYSVTHTMVENPLQEAEDAPVAVGHASTTFPNVEKGGPYSGFTGVEFPTPRENPVVTEGTTEVPASGYQFADPNDPIRARYVEMEWQKDEDIAKLVKMGDGRPKV